MSASITVRRFAAFAVLAAALLAASSALAQSPSQSPPPPARRSSADLPAAPPSATLYDPGQVLRQMTDPVVADVDGTAITLNDLGDAINRLPNRERSMPFDLLYPYVLDHLIEQRALVIKARREHLDQDPVIKRYMQEATDRVLQTQVLNRMLDNAASDEAVSARYQKEYEGKPGPEQVQLSVVLTRTEEKARELIKELAGGADFATIARRDSLDPTRKVGGDLGFRRLEELNPLVGGAAFVMEPGQVSPNPIHGPAGWYVIKVEARRRIAAPTIFEARGQLRHEILEEDVAKAAKEVVAGSEVHRYNINGSPLGASSAEQDDTQQPDDSKQ